MKKQKKMMKIQRNFPLYCERIDAMAQKWAEAQSRRLVISDIGDKHFVYLYGNQGQGECSLKIIMEPKPYGNYMRLNNALGFDEPIAHGSNPDEMQSYTFYTFQETEKCLAAFVSGEDWVDL